MIQKRFIRIILMLLIVALAAVVVACDSGQTTVDGIPVGPYKGKLAPDFTLNNLNGEQITLSQFRGKPVLLMFWATWCPQCKLELEYWKTAYADYADEGLQILAIDVNESESQVRGFANKNGVNVMVLLDSNKDVAGSYHARTFPINFFIDREGFVRQVVLGRFSNEADWDVHLQKIFLTSLVTESE